MRELFFIKASPCQNTTLFLDARSEKISPNEFAEIAKRAIDDEHIFSEQVGFILPAKKNSCLRLEMAGQEFCGNASMALASFCVCKNLAKENENFLIECSGMNPPILCNVAIDREKNFFMPTIQLDFTQQAPKIFQQNFFLDGENFCGGIVSSLGIVHFCCEKKFIDDISEKTFEKLMQALQKIIDSPAYGIVFFERNFENSENFLKIRPYVFVKDVGTKVFENACASGSLSVALWLGKNQWKVCQPCRETIFVDVSKKDFPKISTKVFFSCEGKLFL